MRRLSETACSNIGSVQVAPLAFPGEDLPASPASLGIQGDGLKNR